MDYFLTPYTKRTSKWIKDLYVRPESVKLLEENIVHSFTLVLAIFVFDKCPQEWGTKAKISKWDYIKLKSFCTAKKTIIKTKRHPIECKKIFANSISDKRLISKIYKEHIQLNIRKKTTQLKMNRGPE